MRILITGCAGHVGKIAVEGFLEDGWQVTGLDVAWTGDMAQLSGKYPDRFTFVKGSVLDYPLLAKTMAGCDTVLHLAAYRMPYSAPEQEVFQLNVCGTFNAYEACRENGIRFLTAASSINHNGYNMGLYVKNIEEMPVTVRHPSYTTDPYSYSKECVETVGAYFWRRYGISSVMMRFGLEFDYTIEEWMATEAAEDLRALRKRVKTLISMPIGEARAASRQIEKEINERRAMAADAEPVANGTEYVYQMFDKDQEIWSYYIHNFLMFLDRRDMAEAFLCSAKARPEGVNSMIIADHQNMLGLPSMELALRLFPEAKIDEEKLAGTGALVDVTAAQEKIGFKAKHTIADYYDKLFH